ncbi:MAG: hypothetical protein J6X01_01000 [Bacteroidales bacterium]|nr:hypothetical protein [Bacteroidales bacterium]
MKKLLSLLSISFMSVLLSAQTPIGTFRDHLAYNRFYSVAVGDEVYAAGESGVLYFPKNKANVSESDMYKWSKSNGLSDVDIANIAYDKTSKNLVISYANGNLDFIEDNRLTNVPDVKNKQMSGSKRVKRTCFEDGFCYLVYNFGVVVVDLSTYLIRDTWYASALGDCIFFDMAISPERFYIATSQGIYCIDKHSPLVADLGAWQYEDNLVREEFNHIAACQGKVFANRNSHEQGVNGQLSVTDSVFVLEDGQWHFDAGFDAQEVRWFMVFDDIFLLVDWQNVVAYAEDYYDFKYFYVDDILPSLRYADAEGDDVWIADNENGLWHWNRVSGQVSLLTSDGPHSNKSYSLSCEGGVLASTAGGFNIWAPAYFEPACSFFQNGQWNYLSTEFQTPTYAHDLVKVVVNPDKTEECFVSSWGNGLYKCVNGKVVTHYNQSNSPLRGMTNEEVARVSGLCYDAYGNLWVTNSGTVNTLHVLKTDGKWVTINSLRGDINTIAQHVYVDSRGYKWITFPRSSSQSLYVYDDNKTIENQTDDRLRVVNMNAAAEVESSVVKCITEDKNGRMWIGTNKGVKVIYNPSQVFDGGSLPRNIILEQGGYAAVLLEFEEVSCIAVDGANRKWMGTTKAGVFLISENGTEELMHLTAENSVLLSNVIYDIAIDGTTGEVFFSTDKGICSYRGTATEGEEEWYIDVKVFPNPVHSGYTGVIAVSGLMENSFCKIVDAAGNLIWQGYANGGELVWDGKDFRGRRPATGVYFVFSSSKSGKEKNVAKILFIN